MLDKIKRLLTHRTQCHQSKDAYILSENITVYVMIDDSVLILQACSTKKQDITQTIEFMENTRMCKSSVMFSSISISRPALLYLQSFCEWNIEYIEFEIYSFDRMSSDLVPVYSVLQEDRIKELEKKHLCTRDKWPKLLVSDPICKYMGFTPKQCVSYGLDNEFRYIQ
jgi:DNA-directed RNA polymerase subunit H (RpoH/RPB5)